MDRTIAERTPTTWGSGKDSEPEAPGPQHEDTPGVVDPQTPKQPSVAPEPGAPGTDTTIVTQPDEEGGSPSTSGSDEEDDESDTESVHEVEVISEEAEPNVVVGNQLSLAIGGPKPVQSVLMVGSLQRQFGTTRQFKNGDVIEFSGTLEIRGAGVELKGKKGIPTRVQKAIIATLDLAD